MRLELRHRDDEVGLQQFDGQLQLRQFHEAAGQRHRSHVVVVQIGEAGADIAQIVVQARGGNEVFDVPAVAWAFGDDHAGGPGAPQRLCGAGDERRMGVDDALRRVLDHVWLQQDALAPHVHLQYGEAAADDVGQIEVVVRGRQQRHRGGCRMCESSRVVRARPATRRRAGQRGNGQGLQQVAPRDPNPRNPNLINPINPINLINPSLRHETPRSRSLRRSGHTAPSP